MARCKLPTSSLASSCTATCGGFECFSSFGGFVVLDWLAVLDGFVVLDCLAVVDGFVVLDWLAVVDGFVVLDGLAVSVGSAPSQW